MAREQTHLDKLRDQLAIVQAARVGAEQRCRELEADIEREEQAILARLAPVVDGGRELSPDEVHEQVERLKALAGPRTRGPEGT